MHPIVTLTLTLASVVLAAFVVWLWGFGGANDLALWASQSQREVQQAMAGMLRRLRAGDSAALAGLWGLCFAYGFFHAVGPGHGKMLIGGYGVGRRIAALKLSGLAVASSLAQAATAVVLVYSGVLLLGLTRTQIVDFGEDVLAQFSYGAIALVGLWLAWRGLRGLRRIGAVEPHDHGQAHDRIGPDGVCSSCGHRHGPDAEEAAQVQTWRDALALIGAIAIRPCTGALFLLILTWQMGLYWAGIAGAFIMGAGTATVSLAVALGSVTLREGALSQLSGGSVSRHAIPLIELTAGVFIAVLSLQLFLKL